MEIEHCPYHIDVELIPDRKLSEKRKKSGWMQPQRFVYGDLCSACGAKLTQPQQSGLCSHCSWPIGAPYPWHNKNMTYDLLKARKISRKLTFDKYWSTYFAGDLARALEYSPISQIFPNILIYRCPEENCTWESISLGLTSTLFVRGSIPGNYWDEEDEEKYEGDPFESTLGLWQREREAYQEYLRGEMFVRHWIFFESAIFLASCMNYGYVEEVNLIKRNTALDLYTPKPLNFRISFRGNCPSGCYLPKTVFTGVSRPRKIIEFLSGVIRPDDMNRIKSQNTHHQNRVTDFTPLPDGHTH